MILAAISPQTPENNRRAQHEIGELPDSQRPRSLPEP